MRDFPQELVFAFVFGAVWLAQLVYKLLRRKAADVQAQADPEGDALAAPLPLRADPESMQAAAAPASRPVAVLQETPAAVAPRRASPSVRPPVRRFSRQGLFRNRRAVQDAVVIAAILQPCHAQRPHDPG